MTTPDPVNLGAVLPSANTDRLAVLELDPAGRARPVSGADLAGLVARINGFLVSRGVAVGDRVAILADNSVNYVAAYLAIMQLGAIATPLNTKLTAEMVDNLCRDRRVSLVLCDLQHTEIAPSGVPWALLGEAAAGPMDRAAPVWPAPPNAVAEILHTSGSTGRPKGVLLSHQGQLWAVSRLAGQMGEGERIAVAAPLYHMNGLIFSKLALWCGATLVLMPRFDAAAYLDAVDRYACTCLTGVPTMFALMARATAARSQLSGASVRRVMMGSAPLTDALAAETQTMFPEAQLQNSYGTTEIGAAMFGPHPEGVARPPLALGVPRADVQWSLGGAPDREGPLTVRTPAMMLGYDGAPQETRARLKDGWYQTGDIMRRDADGWFYFVGRTDDMFVCGGENIYPTEVERLLERHPGVRQACVVPAQDAIKGQMPVAFIVPRDRDLDPASVKAFALANAPAHLHPRAVVLLEALPLSGAKKIDRATLAPMAQAALDAARRAS